MFKPFLKAFGLTALLIGLGAATVDRGSLNPSVEPLHNKPSAPVEELNQCPGTVQHYTLSPTGYTPIIGSRDSEQGKALYSSYQCAACHAIDGKGGKLGPPLDGIGGHRGKQFIMAHLLNPEEQMREYPEVFGGRPNIMPHLGVSKKEAKQLAEYLLTLPEPKGGFLITAHPKLDPRPPVDPKNPIEAPASADRIAHGKQLFMENNCSMCHSVQGVPTRFGPGLDNVSTKWKPAMKSRTMKLSESEATSVADFLLSLKPSAEAR
jgi:mono/diheme cytochrome c family protein